MSDRSASVRLNAMVDPYAREMARAADATRAVIGELVGLGRVSDRTAQMLAPLGTAGFALGAGIAGGAALGVKAAMDFETAMRNTNSIMEQSESQFTATSDSVRSLALRLPQTATDLAKGLYDIASSGFQGAEGLKVLEASATAATAGLSDTATASGAIVGALNAYGLSAQDAADVSDILFATVNKGVISFPQLAAGMGEWVGTAHAAGVGLDVASAALATMTVNGVSAQDAGTSLNRVLLSFISPSVAMSTALKQIGFDSGAAAVNTLGLSGVMKKLSDAGFNNVTALQALFPETRALRGAFALTANDGEKFAEILGQIADKSARAGSTSRAFEEQSKSSSVQLRLLRNNVTDLAIEFGNSLLPALTGVVDVLSSVLDGFRDLPAPLKTGIAAATLLTGTVGLLGGGFLMILPHIIKVRESLRALGEMAPRTAALVRGAGSSLGTVAVIAGTTAAVIALGDALVHMRDQAKGGRTDLDAAAHAGTKELVATFQDLLRIGKGFDQDFAKGGAAKFFSQLAEGSTGTAMRLRDALKAQGEDVTGLDKILKQVSDSNARAAGDAKRAGGGFDDEAPAATSAADALKTFTDAIDAYLGRAVTGDQANLAWRSSLEDMATKIRDQVGDWGKAGASLDQFTVLGLANRQMMLGLVQDAGTWAKNMADKLSPEQLTAGLRAMADSLVATGTAAGVPTDQLETYRDLILGIPTSATTTITVDTGQAMSGLDALQRKALAVSGQLNSVLGFVSLASSGLLGGAPASTAPTAGAVAPRPVQTPAQRRADEQQRALDFMKSLSDAYDAQNERISNFYKLGRTTREDYLRSLDGQIQREVAMGREGLSKWAQLMDERHQLDVQALDFMAGITEHQRELEDNEFKFGAISKDAYLELLKARLVGLERFSSQWSAIWDQINQISQQGYDKSLDVLNAYEQGRDFQRLFDAASRVKMTAASTGIDYDRLATVAGSSTTWSPTFQSYEANPHAVSTSAADKLRTMAVAGY